MQKLLCTSQTNSDDEMTATQNKGEHFIYVAQNKGEHFIYVALRCLGSPVLSHVTVSPYEYSVCSLRKIWYLMCGSPQSIEQNLNSHKIKRHYIVHMPTF